MDPLGSWGSPQSGLTSGRDGGQWNINVASHPNTPTWPPTHTPGSSIGGGSPRRGVLTTHCLVTMRWLCSHRDWLQVRRPRDLPHPSPSPSLGHCWEMQILMQECGAGLKSLRVMWTLPVWSPHFGEEGPARIQLWHRHLLRRSGCVAPFLTLISPHPFLHSWDLEP